MIGLQYKDTHLQPGFVTNISEICDKLHKHLHSIDFKYARIAKGAYFVGIKEFHAARAFVEIVAEGDAAVPELDFTAACPKTDIYWIGGLEHETEGGDVNGRSHKHEPSIKD